MELNIFNACDKKGVLISPQSNRVSRSSQRWSVRRGGSEAANFHSNDTSRSMEDVSKPLQVDDENEGLESILVADSAEMSQTFSAYCAYYFVVVATIVSLIKQSRPQLNFVKYKVQKAISFTKQTVPNISGSGPKT